MLTPFILPNVYLTSKARLAKNALQHLSQNQKTALQAIGKILTALNSYRDLPLGLNPVECRKLKKINKETTTLAATKTVLIYLKQHSLLYQWKKNCCWEHQQKPLPAQKFDYAYYSAESLLYLGQSLLPSLHYWKTQLVTTCQNTSGSIENTTIRALSELLNILTLKIQAEKQALATAMLLRLQTIAALQSFEIDSFTLLCEKNNITLPVESTHHYTAEQISSSMFVFFHQYIMQSGCLADKKALQQLPWVNNLYYYDSKKQTWTVRNAFSGKRGHCIKRPTWLFRGQTELYYATQDIFALLKTEYGWKNFLHNLTKTVNLESLEKNHIALIALQTEYVRIQKHYNKLFPVCHRHARRRLSAYLKKLHRQMEIITAQQLSNIEIVYEKTLPQEKAELLITLLHFFEKTQSSLTLLDTAYRIPIMRCSRKPVALRLKKYRDSLSVKLRQEYLETLLTKKTTLSKNSRQPCHICCLFPHKNSFSTLLILADILDNEKTTVSYPVIKKILFQLLPSESAEDFFKKTLWHLALRPTCLPEKILPLLKAYQDEHPGDTEYQKDIIRLQNSLSKKYYLLFLIFRNVLFSSTAAYSTWEIYAYTGLSIRQFLHYLTSLDKQQVDSTLHMYLQGYTGKDERVWPLFLSLENKQTQQYIEKRFQALLTIHNVKALSQSLCFSWAKTQTPYQPLLRKWLYSYILHLPLQDKELLWIDTLFVSIFNIPCPTIWKKKRSVYLQSRIAALFTVEKSLSHNADLLYYLKHTPSWETSTTLDKLARTCLNQLPIAFWQKVHHILIQYIAPTTSLTTYWKSWIAHLTLSQNNKKQPRRYLLKTRARLPLSLACTPSLLALHKETQVLLSTRLTKKNTLDKHTISHYIPYKIKPFSPSKKFSCIQAIKAPLTLFWPINTNQKNSVAKGGNSPFLQHMLCDILQNVSLENNIDMLSRKTTTLFSSLKKEECLLAGQLFVQHFSLLYRLSFSPRLKKTEIFYIEETLQILSFIAHKNFLYFQHYSGSTLLFKQENLLGALSLLTQNLTLLSSKQRETLYLDPLVILACKYGALPRTLIRKWKNLCINIIKIAPATLSHENYAKLSTLKSFCEHYKASENIFSTHALYNTHTWQHNSCQKK